MSDPTRVLLVDDDYNWQQILMEILQDMGMEVDVAASRSQAQKFISGPHRLAILDLCLEENDHHNQDGIAIADAIRARDPDCVMLMLTGHATVELAVSVLTEHGVANCLRKEVFRRSDFKKLVRRMLEMAPTQMQTRSGADQPPSIPRDHRTSNQQAEILVVEDDPGWRAILQEILGDIGYLTRVSTSFGEALGVVRRGRFKAAVVDLSLAGPFEDRLGRSDLKPSDISGMEGFRLINSIQAAGIPVIVLSGMADPQVIERAFNERRIFAYLEKQNFNRRTFVQTVSDAQHAESTSSELDVLTDREREVLALVAQGKTNKEIAEVLVITTNTVKRHLKAIFVKLGIHTRSSAAAKIAGTGGPAG